MEWERILITDPIQWWERCKWIETHCSQWQDHTNWAAWQIGQDDILFYVPEKDAVLYHLHWS